MALIVSDNFNGATDGQSLGTYSGGAWAQMSGYSNPMVIDTASGRAKPSSSSSSASYYRNDANPPNANYSVEADITINAGAPGVTARASTSANTFYSARMSGSLAQLYKFVAGSASLLGQFDTGIAAGTTVRVKLEVVADAIRMYLNGSTTATVTASDSAITAAGKPGIRNAAGTPVSFYDNFAANDMAAGTRTLVAETGAFVLAGPTVGLRAARRLVAAPGAFALAGPAVGVLAQRRLQAGIGAFSLGLVDAALRTSRRLPLEPGAFALAGSPAAIKASRRLVAAPGAFALAGPAVVLEYLPLEGPTGPTYTLLADPGTFALSGAAVALRAARRISALVGSFALVGADVGLRAARRLPLGVGAFALAGAPVQLRYGEAEIDASTLPYQIPFGGYQRVVAFNGNGRVVVFAGNINQVRF